MTIKEMQERAYELYQLDWMARHGISLREALSVMADLVQENEYDGGDADTFVSMWADVGFSGGIVFACFEEFLETEYEEESYILELLSRDYRCKQLKKLYLQDRIQQPTMKSRRIASREIYKQASAE